MKKLSSLLLTVMLTLAESVVAQCVFNFDAAQTVRPLSDDFFMEYLKENTYVGDGGYYSQLLLNPFFRKTAEADGMTALETHPMNSGTPVRDNYFGVATWATAADFDNVSLTTLDGTVVYKDAFTSAGNEWNENGGTWAVADGVLRQTNPDDLGSINVCYQRTGYEGVLQLDATKQSGAEGFLLAFSYLDNENYCWWNIGGWGNTQHAIEQCVDGVKTTLATAAGSIVTGQTYRLKVVMEADYVRCYIDDRLVHDITLINASNLYSAAAISDDAGRVLVRVANPTASVQPVVVRLKDADVLSGTLSHKEVSQAFSPAVLDALNVGAVQSTSLTPVLDGAVRFNALARSLNTVELAVADTPIETGIEISTMNNEQLTINNEKSTIYDLSGRRVARPLKGLYIVNGKKVFVKG
ncbi:MAG: hypothetical protein K5778_07205 [Bacteroidaceae bacterium]|nr:hypothetical protein [Bacteroidaceae bacterium]